MITIDLRDPNLRDNIDAMMYFKKSGYPDEVIQEMYNRQLEKDAAADSCPLTGCGNKEA